ncbi:hypothetical protein [Aureispira anguillae]|uniref:Uncharacterized protein n=1 Tax=Aureispira anguillae TaxID=2864201 RepID=A0A916DRP0_9BACT|nr:hypothetical protein [Aureispira anguillae]BDS10527.1 hypothetical protein AsAng_0012350 [Aureispira anguillae]
MKNQPFSYRQSCFAMAIFGCMAFILGVITILYPSYLVNTLNLSASDTNALRLALTLSGIASTNMGAYYIYMAYYEVIPFFKITVVFRMLITVPVILYWSIVYGQDSFLLIALWEGVGALWVLIALKYDSNYLKRIEEI